MKGKFVAVNLHPHPPGQLPPVFAAADIHFTQQFCSSQTQIAAATPNSNNTALSLGPLMAGDLAGMYISLKDVQKHVQPNPWASVCAQKRSQGT